MLAKVSQNRLRESLCITVIRSLVLLEQAFATSKTTSFINLLFSMSMRLVAETHMLFSAPSAFDHAKPGSRENQPGL
jgi:hypothetical protein